MTGYAPLSASAELFRDHGIVDAYQDGTSIFVDLNPAVWIRRNDTQIRDDLSAAVGGALGDLRVRRTASHNLAIFAEMPCRGQPWLEMFGRRLDVGSCDQQPVELQSCILFRDSWQDLPAYMEFYRRSHHVQRFILYDNNSGTALPQEIASGGDVICHRWPLPYHVKIEWEGEVRPHVAAQNSAYSHCLKRYRSAEWTLLLDLDELLVNPTSNGGFLRGSLAALQPQINAVNVPGFWAGQNVRRLDDIGGIEDRSSVACNPKVILRTREHGFTQCIHHAYSRPHQQTQIPGLYFFHLALVSGKRRSCGWPCDVRDPGLRNVSGLGPPQPTAAL